MKLSVKIAGIFAVVAFALTAVSANAAFTRDLTLGSTGADVTELQTWLEAKGFLTIPAGTSKGYFGGLTQAALVKYQISAGITPAAGYFGPVTRAKVAAGTSTTPTTPGSDDLSGGEASLEQFDISAGDDDDVEEGATGDVAEIEFDVEDGDISIDRIDLALVADVDNEEVDPWDVFDSITLSVEGDEIAEMDLSDEDEYLDEDAGTIRLSDIDFKVKEGESVTIVASLTAQNSVDGANGDAFWTINVDTDGIRATDAEGIQQYIGEDDTVDFEIVEKGDGEELNIKSSSDTPESATLLVDEDDKSDWHEAFIFKLEAEESDIELDDIVLKAMTGTADYENVVNDVKIEIDGEEFDDFEVVAGDSDEATLTFDIDGDFTIDADEEVEVVVSVEFKNANLYVEGTETIQFTAFDANGEGSDDVSATQTTDSELMTLNTSVGEVTNVSWASSKTDSTGVIDLFFTVTAEDDDFDVLATSIVDTTTGTAFTNTAGTPETGDYGVLSRVSGDNVAAIGSTGFTVSEGDTVKFRVRYNAAGAGAYEVNVDSVAGQELEDDDQLSPTLVLEAAA